MVCRPAQVQGGAEALRREGRAGTVQLRPRRPHRQGQVAAVQVRLDDGTSQKKRDITRNIVAIFDLNVTIILESFGRVA